MRRIWRWVIGGVLLLLVASAAAYGVRARRNHRPAAIAASVSASGDGQHDQVAPSGAAGMPRGEVTIDPRRQQLVGVRTVTVTRTAIDRTVRAVGLVRYDETTLADVNVRVEGWIRDLYVDATGQRIDQGQPLFSLSSPDISTTANEYAVALKARTAMQDSVLPDARTRADSLAASARQRLLLWGVPAEALRRIEIDGKAPDVVVFTAPAGGVVTEKQAVAGLHVMPGQSLYKIANLSVVWIDADVYERDLAAVHVGASAVLTVDAYPGEHFTGHVAYVYPYLDEQTRTNKVRFEVANTTGRLKPDMYADVSLNADRGRGLVVPLDSVLDSGTEQVVFISRGHGVFDPTPVKVGARTDAGIEILDGVKDGDQVATGAAFFLDSESQLRGALSSYAPAPTTPGAINAALAITLRTDPAPAKTGENTFEATVKDATGAPIADADVSVQLFMAAMPTMNMPAMRNEVPLASVGGGTYRATGDVMMAGQWDATVAVTRGGQRLGSTQLALVAK